MSRAAAGLYYDGRRLQSVAAQAEFAGAGSVVVRAGGLEVRAALADVAIAARVPGAPRILCLPGGAQFHSADGEWVDHWLPLRGLGALAARLEASLTAATGCALASVAIVAALLFIALPRLADFVAGEVSPELEASIGEQVLSAFDLAGFGESELDEGTQNELYAVFDAFVLDTTGAYGAELLFRSAPLGANAFALPGGQVVFTDDLVLLLENDEEFLAIAAHELGHHHHRHALRSAVRTSALLIGLALIGGDAGVIVGAAVEVPRFLLESHYSREFEEEADAYALAALASRGISPQHFADALRRLAESHPDEGDGWLAYASTHPPTATRIARAEAAARDFAE